MEQERLIKRASIFALCANGVFFLYWILCVFFSEGDLPRILLFVCAAVSIGFFVTALVLLLKARKADGDAPVSVAIFITVFSGISVLMFLALIVLSLVLGGQPAPVS